MHLNVSLLIVYNEILTFFAGCLLGHVCCQELIVTHAPKFVKFQEQANNLQTSDVSKVITHTLGVPTDVGWLYAFI